MNLPCFQISKHYPEDSTEIIKRVEAVLGGDHVKSQVGRDKTIYIYIKESTNIAMFDKVEVLIKESFAPRNILVVLEIP